MYSLHQSAHSRGLQAEGERELAPGLGRVSCGPSETLLSSGWNVCVSVPPSPSKWPKSSPFIVEGRTRVVHVLLCGVVPTGAACPRPVACSCGGVVVGVVHPWNTGRRGRPIRSCASWEPQECLGVDVATNVSHCGWTMHEAETWSVPRLVLRCGGLGRHGPQYRRGPSVQCRGLGVQRRRLERAADRGHSGRTQWPVTPVIPCPRR